MPDPFDRLKSALADRYSIEREIGSGGMATVYLAEDLKHRRNVAVKVLRPELAAALGPERFVREIEIAARLSHPHILPLYDSGEAGGFLYYVMPFVEGESLRDKLAREHELPVLEAVRILRDVVDALAKAHGQGVVHRDIKPDNVMLSDRHALVTDFGVAKAVSEATGRQGLTTAGVALGTPAYMAPEQAAAETHIDHRADIYAVGVLAYELLAGRPPFTGSSSQALLAAHITQTPDPVTQHRAAVPPALSDVIMCCLEKKPADRWQSAEELLKQLEAFATPSGGVTPTETRPVASVRSASRTRIGVAVAAVVAIGAGVFVMLRGGDATDPRRSLVVFPFENRTGDPELDWLQEASVNGIGLNLAHWEDLRVYDEERTASLMRRRGMEAGNIDFEEARALAREADVGTLILGEIRREGDSLVFDAKVHDVASGERIGREIVPSARGADHRVVFDSIGGLVLRVSGAPPGERPGMLQQTTTSIAAYRAYLAGMTAFQGFEWDTAEAYLRRAISLDSTFALGYLKLAWTLAWRESFLEFGDQGSTLGEQRRLLALAQRYSGELPPRFRRLVEYRAAFAEERMDEARSIAERLIAQDPSDAEAWYQLGEAHWHGGGRDFPHADSLGNVGKALRAFEHTLAADSGYILAYLHTIQALTSCVEPLNGMLATTRGGGWVCLADSAIYGSQEVLEQAVGAAAIEEIARGLMERQVRVAYGWVAALPQSSQAREELVRVLLERKRYDEAEQQVAMLREMGSRAASTYDAQLLLGTGRYHEAAERASEAVAAEPISTLGPRMSWLMPALLSAGRVDEAADLSRRMLALAPDPFPTPEVGMRIPRTLFEQWTETLMHVLSSDSPRAREDVGRFIDAAHASFPADTNVWAFFLPNIAQILILDPDTTLLSRALRGLPEDSAVASRARLALARGDTSVAVALRRMHHDPSVSRPIENVQMFLHAWSWARAITAMEDPRGAIEAYARLDSADFDFDGAPLVVRSWPERAALHQQLGERREAIELYERFIDAWRNPSSHLQPIVDRARAAVAELRGGS